LEYNPKLKTSQLPLILHTVMYLVILHKNIPRIPLFFVEELDELAVLNELLLFPVINRPGNKEVILT
jgi:hypothetical protein